jgi:hypothetical protein
MLFMTKKVMLFYSLSFVVLLLCTSLSTVTFAQTSPTANSSATTPTTSSNGTSTAAPAGGSQLLQRIATIPSLSNIVTMSLVDGIKVSGINLGATDLTLTLKRQTVGTDLTSTGNTSSLPVTILVTKLPVNNLTQLISTAGSTIQLAQAGRNADPTSSVIGGQAILGGGADSSSAAGTNALQILNLLKDVQIGTASIVNANWNTPQTISMGLFGLGNRVAETAPSDFVLVTVIPFQGETNLATLPLN